MNDTVLASSLVDDQKPVQERDLIVPMLLVLAQADRQDHGPVTTFQMHSALKQIFAMSEEDEEVVRVRGVQGEHVTRFMRTVRNVISHDGLTRDGLAKRTPEGLTITPEGRAHLLGFLLEPKDPLPNGEMRVLTDGERILENAIAFRMLVRLAELQKDNKTPVATSQLRKDLKSSFPLSVQDLAPLKNRSDTKIDQIARNVVSHNTLTKNSWATRSEKGFVISNAGKAYVLDTLLDVIPSPDFSFLLRQQEEFQAKVNTVRAQSAKEAAQKRKTKTP